MNGPDSLPGSSDGAEGGDASAPPAMTSRGGLCGTLALSLGHRTFTVELNIARSEVAGPDGIRPRDPFIRHLPITEDAREQARRARFARRPRKHNSADHDAHAPSLEGPASPAGPRKVQFFRPQAHSSTNFWSALDRSEKREFRMHADERTFAGGARLMQEGETADHVIVILSGRTKICTDDDGTERLIAERGPGQLVGERAALQVSVRSATVIALETVQALVMRTEDFAAFVSAHPDVLSIVGKQVYERLTEGPSQREYDIVPASTPVSGTRYAEDGTAGHGQGRRPPLTGENCTVLFTDVVAFAAAVRDDEDRLIIRQAFLNMTSAALKGAWGECICEDRGDGLLIVVPPNIPTAQVLDDLLSVLPGALRQHNHIYDVCLRIQLRVAVDVGPVATDSLGVSGQAIIRAARLVEAPVLKRSVARSGANLGLIVSDFVYDTAIRQKSRGDPPSYTEVKVAVKEARLRGWMLLVDSAPRLTGQQESLRRQAVTSSRTTAA